MDEMLRHVAVSFMLTLSTAAALKYLWLTRNFCCQNYQKLC